MDVIKWWTRSYMRSRFAGAFPNNKFPEYMGETIRQLLARGAQILCAVNPDNQAQVLGFICHELTRESEPVVHYLFVKDYYRRNGISKALLQQAQIPTDGSAFYTHRTDFSKHYKARFAPEIARRKEA